VSDISVRSKYGTDLIFKLTSSIEEQEESGICTLKTTFYNKILVDKCHNLGGKWDADQKAWIFSGIVEDKVEMLDEKYNSKMIPVEISFIERYGSDTNEPLDLIGFNIATATGRDSGARIGRGVSLIKGSLTSGGSIKNWCTVARKGTVIRMHIPELCIDELSGEYDISITRIEGKK
jgi:hypothetical protein